MTPEEREAEDIDNEVESRVQASLREEGADPLSDSDHAMFLRQDIRNEVVHERREKQKAELDAILRDLPEQTKKNVAEMTHAQREEWKLRVRLARDFPGIEDYVHTMFFKHPNADTEFRLKLLWGFLKEPNSKLDFRQFKRLVSLINCPDPIG